MAAVRQPPPRLHARCARLAVWLSVAAVAAAAVAGNSSTNHGDGQADHEKSEKQPSLPHKAADGGGHASHGGLADHETVSSDTGEESAAAEVAATDVDPEREQCQPVVTLPDYINKRNTHGSECPFNATFLRPEQISKGKQDHAEGLDPSLPRDCRHEIGVQFLWPAINAKDVNNVTGKVNEGSRYDFKLWRAGPKASLPIMSYGYLNRLTVHIPGMHVLEHPDKPHRFDAEVRLQVKGWSRWWTRVHAEDFDVVVPLEVSYAWDSSRHPIATWLLRGDPGEACDWSLQGVGNWIWWLFSCPGRYLDVNWILDKNDQRALWYSAGEGCRGTFVMASSLRISHHQFDQLQEMLTKLEGAGAGAGANTTAGANATAGDAAPEAPEVQALQTTNRFKPEHLYVASALRSLECFSVFDDVELEDRMWRFMIGTCVLCCFSMLLFVGFKFNPSCGHGLDVQEFMSDPCVHWCTYVDFAISHIVALLIPAAAYMLSAMNPTTGMPMEFLFGWFLWIFLHEVHELYWVAKAGWAIEKIGYFKLCCLVLRSEFGMMHYSLHARFGFLCLFYHPFLGFLSLGTFCVGSIGGQVLRQFFLEVDAFTYHVRNFNVLYRLVLVTKKERKGWGRSSGIGNLGDVASPEPEQVGLVKNGDPPPPPVGEGGEWDHSHGGVFYLVSMVTDTVQLLLMMRYIYMVGSNRTVDIAILSTVYSMLERPVGSYLHMWWREIAGNIEERRMHRLEERQGSGSSADKTPR